MAEIIIQFHQIEFPDLWEQIVIQFPHLGEQIFNQLDGRISENVEKLKNLGSFLLTVKDFHGSKPWIRAIKKHLKFNKDWKEVVQYGEYYHHIVQRSNVKTENC